MDGFLSLFDPSEGSVNKSQTVKNCGNGIKFNNRNGNTRQTYINSKKYQGLNSTKDEMNGNGHCKIQMSPVMPVMDFEQEMLPPEPQLGNIEYKLKLINPSKQRFEHLVTQMKWRLREGQGEAIYEIGVADSGQLHGLSEVDMTDSLHTLTKMATKLGASTTVLRRKSIPGKLTKKGHVTFTKKLLISNRSTNSC